MKRWIVQGDRVRVGVIWQGGHLDPVRFETDNGPFEPMHVAPWANEPTDPGLPPMLRLLRGDFFCAPFGASDVLAHEA